MGINTAAASLVLGAALMAALPARAEEPEALVKEAEALIAKGDYKAACPKLREAERAKPSLETLEALASCDDKAGNKASAYQEYGDLIPRAKAAYADAVARRAEERRTALSAELAKVVFVVPRTTKLTYSIELDGVVLQSDRVGVELLLSAGTHHLKVTTNGGPETQMDTDFEVPGKLAKSTVTIPLDKPNDAIAPQPAPQPQTGPRTIIVQAGPGGTTEPYVEKRNNPALAAVGGAMLGLGVISIFTAAGFGIASIGNDDYGGTAWGFFIGGLIGMGAGIPMLVVGAIKRPVHQARGPGDDATLAIPAVRVGPGSISATWVF